MAMRHKDFGALILTHGRPDNVLTYKSLRRRGYTGPIWVVIDNEDATAEEYRERYGDQVVMFDKAAVAKTFDQGDNFQDRRAVIYARNASFQIARDLGLNTFLQLDDDYNHFDYRITAHMEYPHGSDHWIVQKRLDQIFDAYLDFYETINAKSIAMSQGGDFFATAEAFGRAKRKVMNTFFCSVDRPFQFVGRVNEDVNTYVWYQGLGNLFLTAPFVVVDQESTQVQSGGMTELYVGSGTYVKSFYTVMYAPSCTRIRPMGQKHMRLHHAISWDHAVPCILSEEWRLASRSPRAEESRPPSDDGAQRE